MNDPRFEHAIRLFNDGEFFACHDVLEEIWNETLGDERRFYQGLIHAAVSLFHFEGGNLGGARRMYDSTVNYLSPYRPRFLGVDVDGFLESYQRCFAELTRPHTSYPRDLTLNATLIPRIGLHLAIP